MPPIDVRPLGVLALLDDPVPLEPLVLHLRSQGFHVDTVRDLAGARASFFGAGGHDCLVVAHDVRPGVATAVLQSLRTVDPDLPTATFGPDPGPRRPNRRTARLSGFHPGSRAGVGALVRFLRSLSPR